jgi:tetratricopeptide (TPR) repeat protein
MTVHKLGIQNIACLLVAAVIVSCGCDGQKENPAPAETSKTAAKPKDLGDYAAEVAKANKKDEATATACDLAALLEPGTASAKALLKQALTIREGLYGLSHPKVARSLQHLAIVCRQMKEYGEAAEALKRAVGIYEAAQPQDGASLIGALAELSALLHEQGIEEEAKQTLARAAACAEGMGSEAPKAFREIAQSLNQQDRHEEAVQYLLRAMERLNPDDIDERGELRLALIEAYWRAKAYDKAEPLLQEKLAEAEKSGGSDLRYAVQDLARCYTEHGQYAQAADLWKRSLALEEKEYGPNDPRLAWTLKWYAGVLRDLGRDQEAASLEQRATRLSEKSAK